jgi:hypothetical protein
VAVKKWLTNFMDNNMESSLLCKAQVKILCDIGNEMLDLKVEEIIMAPLCNYKKNLGGPSSHCCHQIIMR